MRDKPQEMKDRVRDAIVKSLKEVKEGVSYLRIGIYPTQPEGTLYICTPLTFKGDLFTKEEGVNVYIHAEHESSDSFFICLSSWSVDSENPALGKGRLFKYSTELYEILTTLVQDNDTKTYLELISE